MSSWAASEDALVEQPALAWLCGAGQRGTVAGWQHVHGAEVAPDAPARERKVWSDVVLVDRLRGAVARINPRLPPEAVTRACDLALSSSSPAVVEDHRAFHELLLSGVPVSYVDSEGIERHDHAWLVDFENPSGNEFLAVNQLTIIVGQKNRRPDILLFVNGLPLGQVELKAPGVDALEAVNQVQHYRDTIPGLYRYVEIVGVSNLTAARVGTITTRAEHFSEWKTMGVDEQARGRSQLEVMIEGVFAPERFLELIRDFVLFESDGARTWKVLAKYHQVHAVTAAVESCATAIDGDRRGGLVWHTQGPGRATRWCSSWASCDATGGSAIRRWWRSPIALIWTTSSPRLSPPRIWRRRVGRRRRSPAARGACISCCGSRRAGSCSRRSRSLRRPPRTTRCRCSARVRTWS